MPTPSDSQDGARRRDDAEPLSLDQAVDKIKKLGETTLWFDQQRELLFAQVNGLRADVARLEAERDEAVMYSNLYRHERNSAEASLQGALRELDTMRPVYDAAVERAQVLRDLREFGSGSDGWSERDTASDHAILAAVDQTAPSSPLETRHTADGGEAGVVEGAGGSEAAERSPRVWDVPKVDSDVRTVSDCDDTEWTRGVAADPVIQWWDRPYGDGTTSISESDLIIHFGPLIEVPDA